MASSSGGHHVPAVRVTWPALGVDNWLDPIESSPLNGEDTICQPIKGVASMYDTLSSKTSVLVRVYDTTFALGQSIVILLIRYILLII